jgi:hypothetical protein
MSLRTTSMILLILSMLILTGCKTVSREEIDAVLWLNNAPLPAEICAVSDRYGFYRKLNDGKLEFISWCKTEAADYVAIRKDDLEKIFKKAGLKKSAQTVQRQLVRERSELDRRADEYSAP